MKVPSPPRDCQRFYWTVIFCLIGCYDPTVSVAQSPEVPILLPQVDPPEIRQESIVTPEDKIAEDVLPPPDPRWYYPPIWRPSKVWDGSFELGMNGNEGNSDTLSFRVGGNLKREFKRSTLDLDVIYARAKADGVETQNNAIFNQQYDWLLGHSPWSVFQKLGLEYDEFKAFDLRLVLNGGFGYKLIESDSLELVTRFGAGTSREFRGPVDTWAPEAVFGLSYEHELTKRQKFNAKFDYLPEWGDFGDFRIASEANFEVLLDEATDLNLKVGITDRYDSTPHGARPNDFTYAIMLLWNL